MSRHWHSSHTQIHWTCAALTEGRTITHLDEIGEVQGWRLGAIVHNLRHRYKWPILVDYRGPERIAHYRLRPGCNALSLDYPRSAKGVRDDLKARAEASSPPAADDGARDG